MALNRMWSNILRNRAPTPYNVDQIKTGVTPRPAVGGGTRTTRQWNPANRTLADLSNQRNAIAARNQAQTPTRSNRMWSRPLMDRTSTLPGARGNPQNPAFQQRQAPYGGRTRGNYNQWGTMGRMGLDPRMLQQMINSRRFPTYGNTGQPRFNTRRHGASYGYNPQRNFGGTPSTGLRGRVADIRMSGYNPGMW